MNFNNHVTNSKLDEQYESLSKVLTGLSAKMIQTVPIPDTYDNGELDAVDSKEHHI